ncbi:unnamed protein product [Boreogadus saida]
MQSRSGPWALENCWLLTRTGALPATWPGHGLMPTEGLQHREVFQQITEVSVLVPASMGLKGNLEMTLASRLSTVPNTGPMDDPGQQWAMGWCSNVNPHVKAQLHHVQATLVGFLAAVAAVLLGVLTRGRLDLVQASSLNASSVSTAFITASLL